MAKKEKYKIAVFDIETDPFKHGRKPEPFCCGFYDGDLYKEFWGADCIEQFIIYCESLDTKHIIYAHNGGKFDFFYLLEKKALTNPAVLINGRIVKCGFIDKHELRDSYAIIPIPLAAYKKDDIDYDTFEKPKRNKHKAKILEYLKSDCIYTYELITKFIERFGMKLTIGATAINQLGLCHNIIKGNAEHDMKFRPFYFGGRVECFKTGVLKGKWKIYDVNSMYPKAMRDYPHPIGLKYIEFGDEISDRFDFKSGALKNFGGMYFIRFIGSNRGALPVRLKTGLSFNEPYGEFCTTSHELKIALKYGLVTVDKILEIKVPCNTQVYDIYVDKYMAEKIDAKKRGEIADEIFAKLLLNSAYGKYATDITKFKDWFILDLADDACIEAFNKWREKNPESELETALGLYEIWNAPSNSERGYFDVAIAASITSAARSMLLEAKINSTNPIYCDTDSLICEELHNVEIHDSKLGAWKFEGKTDTVFIAGKKIYCAVGAGKGGADKIASKGARLGRAEILSLCEGETVTWQNSAPNFKRSGEVVFIERKIRSTA